MKAPKVTWMLSLFVVLSSSAMAQLSQADKLAATGDSLRQAGWYQSSTIYLQKAASLYQQQARWNGYVRCLTLLSANHVDSEEYDRAHQYAQEAVAEGQRKLFSEKNEVTQAYLAMSVVFMHREQYDSAWVYYHLAVQTTNDEASLARSYYTLGQIHDGLHHKDSAMVYYHKAVVSLRDSVHIYPLLLADTYFRMGTYYNDRSVYDTAISYYQKSRDVLQNTQHKLHPMMVQIYTNMAVCFNAKSDLDQSLAYFLKALEVQQHFFGDNNATARCYRRVGLAYFYQRAFSKAHDYFRRAVDLLEHTDDRAYLATAYMSLGTNAIRSENFQLGKSALQKAFNIWYASANRDSTLLGQILNNTAIGYEEAGNLDSAMIYYQKALTVAEQTSQKNPASISIYHHNIGNLYLMKNQLDRALYHAQQALSLRERVHSRKNARLASSWSLLGEIYAKQGNQDQALRSFQQALVSNVLNFEDTTVLSYPSAQSGWLDAYELLETLYYQANTLITYKPSASEPVTALTALQLSDTIIDQLQRSYQTQDDKITLKKKARKIYQLAVRASVLCFRQNDDSVYLHQAFYFSEKSKASVLTHALAEVSAQHQAGIPDSLLAQERTLSIDRAYYTSQIQTEKSNPKVDSSALHHYQDKLFTISLQYDALIQQLETQHPKYYRLKYYNPIITVPQLQQQLAQNTTLVSSFLSDSTIYQFVVTSDILRVVIQPYDSTLLKNITQLRSTLTPEAITELSQDTYRTYTKSASFLYQILLDAALSSKTVTEPNHPARLIIIADDILGYVPFDVLLTQPVATQTPDYRSLPYLLNDYDVSYGYSATWLFQPSVKNAAEAPRELVAFASSPTESSTNQLVWNQTEVDKVSYHVTTQSYTGLQAQEYRFKTEAEQYRFIHLAMHGYADEEDPLESRIVFSSAEDDYEDNILYAHELYDMQLSADLAVLSACQTGDGALAEGEGILSLARAFAYAGCASVVMSHWAADDQSTATLMDYFYQHLAEGKSKDQALSEAKRTFLSQTHAAFTHPYYWANFMLIGNADPIKANNARQTIYLILIGMGLVVAVIAATRIKV